MWYWLVSLWVLCEALNIKCGIWAMYFVVSGNIPSSAHHWNEMHEWNCVETPVRHSPDWTDNQLRGFIDNKQWWSTSLDHSWNLLAQSVSHGHPRLLGWSRCVVHPKIGQTRVNIQLEEGLRRELWREGVGIYLVGVVYNLSCSSSWKRAYSLAGWMSIL